MSPFPVYSLDTHVLFWHMMGAGLLSPKAQQIFNDASQGKCRLIVSHIVLAELFYLLKKQGQDGLFDGIINRIHALPSFRIEGLEVADLRQLPNYPEIPEMHDRLIAIQAKRLGAILVTKDGKIQASPQVQWVW